MDASKENDDEEVIIVSDTEDLGDEMTSDYYDDDDDDDSENGDNYYDDDMCSAGPDIHPQLVKDLELLRQHVSPMLVETRSLDDIHEMDIEIPVNTSNLERSVAEAWGLVYQEPLKVKVTLNQKVYLSVNNVDKVEVFQKTLLSSRVFIQLKKIIESFCSKQFNLLENHIVGKAVQCASSTSRHIDKDLLDMGFDHASVTAALTATDGDRAKAVELLLHGLEDDILLGQSRDTGMIACQQESGASSMVCSRIDQEIKATPGLEQGFLCQLHSYIEKRLHTLNDFCPLCDNKHDVLHQAMLKPVVCDNPLCIFSQETLGVMAGIATVIKTQPTVSHLLILLTKAAAMSQRMSKIMSPYPSVVDPKHSTHMIFHVNNKSAAMDAELKKVLNCVKVVKPCLEEPLSELKLKEMLEKQHELCYPLVRWILNSNRSHIVQLPSHKKLSFMTNWNQFLLRNSPPVRDANFRTMKAKFGSVFAFHGSPIENWHSIVREGLIVASGTEKQLHGAAYGKGIYLSPSISTSLGYCHIHHIHNAHLDSSKKNQSTDKVKENHNLSLDEYAFLGGLPPLDPSKMICLALCEVINDKNLIKHGGHHIWTCVKKENICTRFFFVSNLGSHYHNAQIDVSKDNRLEEIRNVLKDHT